MNLKINAIKKYLEDKKVKDVLVVDTTKLTPFYDTVIIGTALNIRNLGTLKNNVADLAIQKGFALNHIEGKEETGWVIIDCGELVIHLFTNEERKRIELESLLTTITKKSKAKKKK